MKFYYLLPLLILTACINTDDDAEPVGPYDDCAYPRENFLDTTDAAFNVFQANLNGDPWLPGDNTWGGVGDPAAKILVSQTDHSVTFSTRRDIIQHKDHCKWAIPDIRETLIFRIDAMTMTVGQHQPQSTAIYRKRDDDYTFYLDTTVVSNMINIESAYAVDGNLRVSGTFHLTFIAEEDPTVKAVFSDGVFRMTQNSL